ncbi:unnamed protein product, partial [marine sediment metagenome]
MDIDAFIKKEAPDAKTDIHDKYYAIALRDVYGGYKDLDYAKLLEFQRLNREVDKGSSHYRIAALMVIQELMDEKTEG